ncbi:hypothetical protein ACH0B6_19150 [Solibacillus silvestris]
MAFTYENVETVEVKEDFEVHTFDCNDEIVNTTLIKKGTVGEVESMHYETGEPEAYYVIFLESEDEHIAIYESDFEKRLKIKNVDHEIVTTNNLSDLNTKQFKELEEHIEGFITLKAYIEVFIAQHNLDEDEVWGKIDDDYKEAMSRKNG